MHAFSNAVSAVPAVAPAIGTAPPGMGQITTILGWVAFFVGVALIGAFMVSLGGTGMKALRHGQFEGGMGAVVCLVCGVALGATGAIFGALGISV